ncbi:hypothetical protein O6H91_02G143800 [Diphasiastrum complanatum]|uniref:Uncharacterized protein n=1 Tax=Diphasiastrum complanatum TaxID=34168 RepID=A0ACC2ELV1_DIPCM|nr:hypothetical protein O6H91_02G143800 [Diphasiastrum complanatum]
MSMARSRTHTLSSTAALIKGKLQCPSFPPSRSLHLPISAQISAIVQTKLCTGKPSDRALLHRPIWFSNLLLQCGMPWLPSSLGLSCRGVSSSIGCLNSDVSDLNSEEGRWNAGVQPPRAPRRSFLRAEHGLSWDDPYHWLSNSSDPAVLEYLTRENRYADDVMARTLRLQQELEREMVNRMPKELSAPGERWGPWLYCARVPEGKDYAVYLRKRVDESVIPAASWKAFSEKAFGRRSNASEEVLLDLNEIAEQYGYVQLGMFKLSQDHRLVAYTVDLTGEEVFTLFVKDLATGKVISHQKIEGVIGVEWASKGYSLVYTTPDALRRPSRVFYRNFTCGTDDVLVFEEKDPQRFVDVTRTKDWSYILINVNSKTSSEVFLIQSKNPTGAIQRVEERQDNVQYFVEHHEGYLYILTNRSGPKEKEITVTDSYRLVRCDVRGLSFNNWQEIIPFQRESWVEDMDIFEKHLVTYHRESGIPCIKVLDLPFSLEIGGKLLSSFWTVPLPNSTCIVTPGANSDFNSTVLRIEVSSPTLPDATLDIDLSLKRSRFLQQLQICGSDVSYVQRSGANKHEETFVKNRLQTAASADESHPSEIICRKDYGGGTEVQDTWPLDMSSRYSCNHFEVTSQDYARIPLTVVHSKSLRMDGLNPALLMGYGAYGEVLELGFSADRMSLLDRGWVLAFAHVRGGGELGKGWHDSGKLLQKKNSFHDLLACGDFLVEHKFVHPKKIAGWGESAGGLLVAAAANIRPDFFRAIVLKVPFVDVCNTMLDPSLHLTVHEYDEWGNPSEVNTFQYIRSYSPYDNINGGVCYPAMLVTAAFNDTRVGYWEAAKYIARLREAHLYDTNKPLLFKTRLQTGHFGEGGRYQHLKETAYDFSFLIEMMFE